MSRRQFGYLRRLPSGRWQASYLGPDSHRYTARTTDARPLTFDGKTAAGAYLARVHSDIQRGNWISPDAPSRKVPVFSAYATDWLATRTLAGSTRALYSITLRNQILPTFGAMKLNTITPAEVRTWHANLDTGPGQKTTAYRVLKSILSTAVDDELIPSNPCRIKGAGQTTRARTIKPASIAEVGAIADAMPPKLRAAVLLAAWAGLRLGEVTALTRADLDLDDGRVHVRRAVSREASGNIIKSPKTAAGKRTVALPPHVLPALRDHVRRHVGVGPASFLFPADRDLSRPLPASTLRGHYQKAAKSAGRPDLHFHALRHTSATLAAATGATLRELMDRMGHSTVQAAMVYQHTATNRDQMIAMALSRLAEGEVVPIRQVEQAG